MRKYEARRQRWFERSDGTWMCGPEGYLFASGGCWHLMLCNRYSQQYVGKRRRLREAKMCMEEALRCLERGLGG